MNTAKNNVYTIAIFFEGLGREGVLEGEVNRPFLGLNSLERADYDKYINRMLSSTAAPESGVRGIAAINRMKIGLLRYQEEAPFLKANVTAPWEASDLKPLEWSKQRISDLGLVEREKTPYKAFGAETTAPLVQKSLDILDHYAEPAIDLFGDGVLCANWSRSQNSSAGRFSDSIRIRHAKQFKGVFDDILPMVIDKKGRASGHWYRKLFYILQGAMINIILLTTGLRNSDVRQLKIGCSTPSDAEEHLFYIDTWLQKTGNHIHIPIPLNAHRAIKALEQLRFSDECLFLVTRYTPKIPKGLKLLDGMDGERTEAHYLATYKTNIRDAQLNKMLRSFAAHFNIPFISDNGEDGEGTAHRYRATVAGWLASASKLSVLLVRRLFGHTNNLMPLAYLHHNPNFRQAIEEGKVIASEQMALSLSRGAEAGRLGGIKGKQLNRGYEYRRGKFQSATETELFTTFKEEMARRLEGGQLCGFLTPLSVVCGRNPIDTSPTPCGKQAFQNELAAKEVDKAIVSHLSVVRPDLCIGNRCKEAIVGEWSTALRDTFVWYVQLLKGMYADYFDEEHYQAEAKAFIEQYADDMLIVFGLEKSDV